MASKNQPKLKKIIDLKVANELSTRGFKRVKNIFIKENEETIYAITFTLSGKNSGMISGFEFTVDLGIYYRKLGEVLEKYRVENIKEIKNMYAAMCAHLSVNLSEIVEPPIINWYYCDDNDEDKMSETLYEHLFTYGINWFSKVENPADAIEYVNKTRNPKLIIRAALSVLINDFAQAKVYLKNDYEKAAAKTNLDNMVALAAKYGLDLPDKYQK